MSRILLSPTVRLIHIHVMRWATVMTSSLYLASGRPLRLPAIRSHPQSPHVVVLANGALEYVISEHMKLSSRELGHLLRSSDALQ